MYLIEINTLVLKKLVDKYKKPVIINNLLRRFTVATALPRTSPRVNYLNNRDILKEIHLSKNNYCTYSDPVNDHQYDIILPSLSKINVRSVAEARRNRADRIKRETGQVVNPKKILHTELVFRVTCWEHIPMAVKKIPKSQLKKQKIEDILEFDAADENPVDELLDIPVLDDTRMRLNFPPFYHYRLDADKLPFQVGKSHWRGDFETGEFSKDHGAMTRKLATMFLKLCERYGTRSNWRGYCVDVETEALTDRGWLTYSAITENDRILSYDGKNVIWSKIKSIYRNEFDGLMHNLTVKGMDALITPGHKLVTESGLKKVEYLLETDKVILMGEAELTPFDKTYTDHMVELLGWIVTEGCYQLPKNSIQIYQNSGAKADRIRNCLEMLNFKFSETGSRKNICFSLGVDASKEVFEILPVKNLNMEFILSLTADQRELLINTMIDGDGWKRGNSRSYCQKDKEHIDYFQALCSLSGYKTNSHYVKDHLSYGKLVNFYTVNFFNRKTTRGTCIDFHGGKRNGRTHIGLGKASHPNEPTTYYNGIVWCPETEYGCFIARRNGKVYLTGNTYNEEMRGQALLQLSQIGLQFDESRSQNPFAYYTAAITNSFTRILNLEKKNQNIRDDILEMNGLDPSWTRQNSGKRAREIMPVTVIDHTAESFREI